MASASLGKWKAARALELDRLEAAHVAVGGTGRGRRYATQQVNQAYVVLLSSHFQGFCRDLHAEAIDYFVDSIQPPSARVAVRTALAWKRSLDRGNPTPDNIAADFNRFGMTFWPEVYAVDLGGAKRETALKELNKWRIAIAHHDFDASKLAGRTTVTLQMVQRWRSACNGLARSFDRVVSARITKLTGAKTW